MKIIICALVFLFSLFFVFPSMAEDLTETLTFEWDQEDTTNLKDWRLYWSDNAGGPYDEKEVAIIAYNPSDPGPTYSSPAAASVSGPQGSTVTKYFVLVACGDIPQPDQTTKYECSENSNEVSYNFWIPAGQFSIPIKFKIVVQ